MRIAEYVPPYPPWRRPTFHHQDLGIARPGHARPGLMLAIPPPGAIHERPLLCPGSFLAFLPPYAVRRLTLNHCAEWPQQPPAFHLNCSNTFFFFSADPTDTTPCFVPCHAPPSYRQPS